MEWANIRREDTLHTKRLDSTMSRQHLAKSHNAKLLSMSTSALRFLLKRDSPFALASKSFSSIAINEILGRRLTIGHMSSIGPHVSNEGNLSRRIS
jgi:hypothetical protein